MTTINLKDFFYWYITDEEIEVSDKVAKELLADKRYESTHHRRQKRNNANYSLDVGDGIENSICEHEPSAQELLDRKEEFMRLCRALNSLPEMQGRRIDAHLILGKTLREIAADEGVSINAVSLSVKLGLENMKKFLKDF